MAVRDFTKVLQLNPSEPEGFYNRGLIYQKQNNYVLAIADYDRYIELNTDNKSFLADGYYNRGLAKNDLGKYDSAIRDFTNAIQLSPQLSNAYKERAWAYRKMGNVKLAQADEAVVVELEKNN
jgi:tetratricopeptide (TPR) repeat protein